MRIKILKKKNKIKTLEVDQPKAKREGEKECKDIPKKNLCSCNICKHFEYEFRFFAGYTGQGRCTIGNRRGKFNCKDSGCDDYKYSKESKKEYESYKNQEPCLPF